MERNKALPQDRHTPVLLNRCIELLTQSRTPGERIYVDCTLGMGGHTHALLASDPQCRVIGIDRDQQALDLASGRLNEFGSRFIPVHAVYDELNGVLDELGIPMVTGILMDLGVSSLQIDETQRGFSYAQDAPLDMRMDQSQELTAAHILNNYDEQEISRILWDYGEERFARSIARRVVKRRLDGGVQSTADLVDIVRASIPAAARKTGGNPAKRTFQALRIEVNGELSALEQAIPQALDRLDLGGRLVVMAYQSLEDRIVKQLFRQVSSHSAPPGLPVIPQESLPNFALLTKGAERASDEELELNPRSAPVRLRAVERTRPLTRRPA